MEYKLKMNKLVEKCANIEYYYIFLLVNAHKRSALKRFVCTCSFCYN